MRPFQLALTAALLVGRATSKTSVATVYHQKGHCWSGCKDATSEVTFGDADPAADYYTGMVKSDMLMTSVALCMKTYCQSQKDMDDGWEKLIEFATMYSVPNLAPSDIPSFADTLAKVDPKNVTNINCLDPNSALVPFNNTILCSKQNYEVGVRTEDVWDEEMSFHHAYGWAMYLLLGIMMIIGLFNRAWAAYISRAARRGDLEDMYAGAPKNGGFFSRIYTGYRRHIGVPATFGYRHAQAWGWLSIPTRIQSILIFVYVALNFIWTFTNYEIFYENLYWYGQKDIQLWRFVADRTGIMAFYNLPLLWVLAGRNDVLIWITGWSFQSTNVFHRWVARVATVQAVIHSAAYTWLEKGYIPVVWKERYWVTGVFATITMCLMWLPFSIRPIREKLYETFLIIHIFLALATLVLLFYHVAIFDGEYDGWLWACAGVWIFDRLLRLVRVGVLSYKTIGRSNTVATMTTTSADTGPGLIRLVVQSSINFEPKAGSYYFLYTPRSFTPWENHPFTLASWEKKPDGTALHFLFEPQAGATRRIHRRIDKVNSTSSSTMRVLLEGPYGNHHPIAAYDHILLVAGGSGITALLPYVFSLTASPRSIRSVTIVWAVRNAAYAANVLSHELAPKCTQHVNLEVFVTREQGARPFDVVNALEPGVDATVVRPNPDTTMPEEAEGSGSDSRDATMAGETEKHDHDHDHDHESDRASGEKHSAAARLTSGRPSMPGLLRQSIDRLVGAERLAVLACGPASMMDDLRQAVASSYGTGEGQVRGDALEYFEDAFTW